MAQQHHPDGEGTGTWYWMLRGFVTVAVVVAALAALGVWLWLRPLREGPAQSFGLWLACMLLVGCAVLVWSPEPTSRATRLPVTARCGSRAISAIGWWCASTRSTRPTASCIGLGLGTTVIVVVGGGPARQAEVR